MGSWDIEHSQLALEAFKTLGLLFGGGWVLWTFVIGRKFAPMIEFRVDANIFKYSEKTNLVECLLHLNNKGLTRHKFRDLTITVRGLKGDSDLEGWSGHGGLVKFSECIVLNEPIFPKDWRYSFIEPGVTQTYVYVAVSATEVSHILLHGEFTYGSGDPHTARKILATASPSFSPAPGTAV